MIGIVGASLAGLTVARTLRSLGVTEPIILVGAEPWLPYDRPPLSKEVITAGDESIAPDPGWATLLTPGEADEFDWRLGVAATGLAPGPVIHTDHGDIPADTVVLATGARARRLPGDVLAGVHTLRTLDDARRLADDLHDARDLVVIGAGFIGAEIASTAAAMGRRVTIVERAADPGAAALGPRLAAWALDLHRRAGVDVVVDAGVADLEAVDGRVRAVRLADGTTIPADVVVVGVGAVAETDWAANSPIAIDGGFLTDAAGATSMPGVWAAGDCARVTAPDAGHAVPHQHWSAAIESARAVAHAVAGHPRPAPRAPYVWSEQHGHRIQICGTMPRGVDPTVVEGSVDDDAFVAVAGDPDRPDAVVAVDMPRPFTRLRKAMDARVAGAVRI
ncbi:FAD-dependent oxidoreductase [uncultured Williamsia sp.]|uniref:NAD(P)/FAD-dependent oxidoreductase n=1 Tax=uncultured Williamsia sp. TaxID=259311 RepID=UPI0026241B18|nr:FAD-dependent oxidoreductase [uncultured Williamsia sp.]